MKKSLFAIILICVFICVFALSLGLSVMYFSKKGAVETGETADEKAENLAGQASKLSDGYEYAEIGDILSDPQSYDLKYVWVEGLCIGAINTYGDNMYLVIRGENGKELDVLVQPSSHEKIPGMNNIQVGSKLRIFGVVSYVRELGTRLHADKIINLHPIQEASIPEILKNPRKWEGKEVEVYGTCLSKEKCEDGYWITLGYPEFKLHVSAGTQAMEEAVWIGQGNNAEAAGVVKLQDGEPYLETRVMQS